MFDWLAQLWQRGLDWLRQTIQQSVVEPIRQYVQGAVLSLRDFLADFGRELSEALGHLFGPLWDWLGGTFYLLDQLAGAVGKVLKIVLLIGQVLFSLGEGVIATLTSVAAFDPASVAAADKSAYATGIDFLLQKASGVGLGIVADVLAVGVWLAAALTVLRLIGGEESA